MRNFSPVSEMRKGQRSWDVFWVKIQETKHTSQNTKILTFTTLTILKAVLLQYVKWDVYMIWKIRQAMQDDAIWATRIHPKNLASPLSHLNILKVLQKI